MKKVIVIGSGIVGVSCALELQRVGKSVTLIDRVPAGDSTQTSFGNAGILAREAVLPVTSPTTLLRFLPQILFSPRCPVYLNWGHVARIMPWMGEFLMNGTASKSGPIIQAMNEVLYDTVEKHTALAKGTDAAQYITKGEMTFLYRNTREFTRDKGDIIARRDLGMTWTELDRSNLLERDPKIAKRYQFGVAYHNHGWITNPGEYVAALAKHFSDIGGKIVQGEVQTLGQGCVSLTDQSTYTADDIVIAAGAWSKVLAEQLGHKVPLQGERGYHITLKNPSHMPPNTYLVFDKRFGVTPMDGFLRVAGQTEFAPLDSAPNPKAIANLRRFLYRVYPDLTHEGETEWQGTRPTLPDSLPMIGRSTKDKSVVFAFGSQHVGLTMGPKLGQMVRDIVIDKPNNIDITPYAPNRFD